MAMVEHFHRRPGGEAKRANERDARSAMIHLFAWLIVADLIAIALVAATITTL